MHPPNLQNQMKCEIMSMTGNEDVPGISCECFFIEVGFDMEVACCVWSKDTKRRKCRVWCDLFDCDIRVTNGKDLCGGN